MLPKKVLSRIQSSRARRRAPHQSSLGQPRKPRMESLETRLLLTASTFLTDSPIDVEQQTAVIVSEPPGTATPASPAHEHDSPALCAQFQLRIEGTAVQYNIATGIPEHLEGNVFYVGGNFDGQYAGTYQEDIVPIFHPDYGLIGADGTGTYSFSNHRGVTTLGKLVVEYRSFIVGLSPTGALLVNSVGTAVDGTRLFRDLEGGFTTSSTVVLGPEFAMQVDINMQLCRTLPAAADSWQVLERLAGSEPRDAFFSGHGEPRDAFFSGHGEPLEHQTGRGNSAHRHDIHARAGRPELSPAPQDSLNPHRGSLSQRQYAHGLDEVLSGSQPLWLQDALTAELLG